MINRLTRIIALKCSSLQCTNERNVLDTKPEQLLQLQ